MAGYWGTIVDQLARTYEAEAAILRASFVWNNQAIDWARRQRAHFNRALRDSGIVFW